jgi:hypothetical protein
MSRRPTEQLVSCKQRRWVPGGFVLFLFLFYFVDKNEYKYEYYDEQ